MGSVQPFYISQSPFAQLASNVLCSLAVVDDIAQRSDDVASALGIENGSLKEARLGVATLAKVGDPHWSGKLTDQDEAKLESLLSCLVKASRGVTDLFNRADKDAGIRSAIYPVLKNRYQGKTQSAAIASFTRNLGIQVGGVKVALATLHK